MAYPVMPLGFLGSQGDNDTYRIERSLRFNSADSAYLNRTFSGTPYTYTLSWWVKRGTLSVEQTMFGSRQGASNPSYVQLLSNNTISIILGVNSTVLTTTMVFRDPSAWYHFVLSVTPSATSYFYVNGVQVGSWTSSATPYLFNSAYTNAIGRYGDNSLFDFNGYMAEINFIDGQALTPSSFGETDPITGRWKAKAYSGTYGTNGFYLKFADNSGTTSTTLGKDSSPNGNNWTPNNFSVTAGTGNDSLVDSPTNYGSDTGVGGEVRGNYATANPIDQSGCTFANGSLDVTMSGLGLAVSSVGVSSGKWYAEITPIASTLDMIGICQIDGTVASRQWSGANGWYYYGLNGQKYNNNTGTSYGASYTTNDVIGIALDMDSGSVTFYKNGATQGVAYNSGIAGKTIAFSIGRGGSVGSGTAAFNFGQRPFAYTAPTGFKALCTTNLSIPTIQKPSKYMDVVTWTGDGSSSRTISGLGFSPDLVWMKTRNAANSHLLYDIVRGASSSGSSKALHTNSTNAEGTVNDNSTFGYLDSFNSNGFGLVKGSSGDYTNLSGNTYVAWSWDEAPIAGMDIVSYTGNGAAQTISHSLGVTPKMIIAKARSTTSDWPVYHSSSNASPQNGGLNLNKTDAFAATSSLWNNTSPTSSSFTVGTGLSSNAVTYIAYLFAEVEGFSRFGSYTGNGSTDGPFVWCGFRPRWVLTKNSSGAADWTLYDSERSNKNVVDFLLSPNTNTGDTASSHLDILSNGFKMRVASSGVNNSGAIHVFAAFAETAFRYARAR